MVGGTQEGTGSLKPPKMCLKSLVRQGDRESRTEVKNGYGIKAGLMPYRGAERLCMKVVSISLTDRKVGTWREWGVMDNLKVGTLPTL